MTAYVSDSGLARLVSRLDKDHANQFSSLDIKGTSGYAAPGTIHHEFASSDIVISSIHRVIVLAFNWRAWELSNLVSEMCTAKEYSCSGEDLPANHSEMNRSCTSMLRWHCLIVF